MRHFLTILLFFALSLSIFGQVKEGEEIKKVLFAQRDAWNRGDLEGYMEGYWKSDSLKFIGKSGITMGWVKTLNNYRKGYPDKAAMGKLEFTIIELSILSKESAFMIGKWDLKREKDSPGGYFTLLWKKIKGEWKVTADHSS